MKKILEYIKNMPVEKNRFGLRTVLVIIGVICQGFGVFWLTNLNFGTDPCTTMNLGLSDKLGWTYGNTIFAYNCLLFLVVIFFGAKQIGIGTIANMVLVGYSADFFGFIFGKILPEGFFEPFKTRAIILVPALLWFVFAAAVYMAVDLGQSPYDAVPAIIASKLPKVPFFVVRIGWDFSMAIIGFLLGSTVGLVTILICLCLGPAITFVKGLLRKIFGFK